jgi:maltose O-acetyltransferase
MGYKTYANFGLKVVPNDSKICVYIGDNVSIAPNVLFICCSSPNNAKELSNIDYISNKLIQSSDIHVEDEVWIGANVTIFPGVSVGKCSVIGAGSIVMNDVESYSVYAGIPAKKIRDLRTGKRLN